MKPKKGSASSFRGRYSDDPPVGTAVPDHDSASHHVQLRPTPCGGFIETTRVPQLSDRLHS